MRQRRIEFPLSIFEPCHQDPVLEGDMDCVEKGEGASGKLWITFSEMETSASRKGSSSVDQSQFIHPKSFFCCKDFMRRRQHCLSGYGDNLDPSKEGRMKGCPWKGDA